MPSLNDIGSFLGGAAAFLVALTPIAGASYFAVRRLIKKGVDDVIEASTYHTQQRVAEAIMGMVQPLDPNHYFTLKLCFPGGFSMAIPMVPERSVIIGENMRMALTDSDSEETTLTLVCKGFGYLKDHYHPDACETILVKKGVMTCTTTGTIYRKGDTWRIPPGEMHGATFQDFIGIITHRPPLPLAIVQPVDVSDMGKVFPNQTP